MTRSPIAAAMLLLLLPAGVYAQDATGQKPCAPMQHAARGDASGAFSDTRVAARGDAKGASTDLQDAARGDASGASPSVQLAAAASCE